MRFLRAVWVVFVKDLLVELRTREIILSTGLFALLVVVLAAFAFGLNTMPGVDASCGVLWIAVAFSGILALGRTYMRERDFGVWTALLMTPVPRAALYMGKMLGLLVFLLVVEIVLIPVIELFFHAPLLANIHLLAPILLAGTLGYAAAGALFGAMTIRTRMKDLLLGVILFPLVAPLLIASVKATEAVLAGHGFAGASDFIKLILIFDGIFILGGLWLFDVLMED